MKMYHIKDQLGKSHENSFKAFSNRAKPPRIDSKEFNKIIFMSYTWWCFKLIDAYFFFLLEGTFEGITYFWPPTVT